MAAVSTRMPAPDYRIQPVVGGSGVPSGKGTTPGGETLPASPPPPPVVDVAKAVERLNDLMTSRQRSLRFEVDPASGRTVITVINQATKEVVRQIPPAELLQIAQNLDALGSLVDAHA